MNDGPRLGVIADDFTGGSDAAASIARHGLRVLQVFGVPEREPADVDADAVVVVLKTRSAPPDVAVSQSVEALRWLSSAGVPRFYLKYSSTFDSTATGNIGPVVDALLDVLGERLTVACPALPALGRTVYRGHLFVGDRLLADSELKDHPLHPMRDSSLIRLAEAQFGRAVGLVPAADVWAGPDAVRRRLDDLRALGAGLAVVDAVRDRDLDVIAAATVDMPLHTGSSGLASALAGLLRESGRLGTSPRPPVRVPVADGRRLIIVGSCSPTTLAQIAHAGTHLPHLFVDPERLAAGADLVAEAVRWAGDQAPGAPLLVYSSAEPTRVRRHQAALGGRVHEIGTTLALIARELVHGGVTSLVVAGGETAGAVVDALGVRAAEVGPEISTGVPWLCPVDHPLAALALKSGNFGGPAFFDDAFRALAVAAP